MMGMVSQLWLDIKMVKIVQHLKYIVISSAPTCRAGSLRSGWRKKQRGPLRQREQIKLILYKYMGENRMLGPGNQFCFRICLICHVCNPASTLLSPHFHPLPRLMGGGIPYYFFFPFNFLILYKILGFYASAVLHSISISFSEVKSCFPNLTLFFN